MSTLKSKHRPVLWSGLIGLAVLAIVWAMYLGTGPDPETSRSQYAAPVKEDGASASDTAADTSM